MEFYLRSLIIFGIVILMTGIMRGRSTMTRTYQLERSAERLREQINQLTTENKKLSTEITKIENSKSYARKVLRDRYHFLDNNENIVFFAE